MPHENIGGLNAEEGVAIHEKAEYMDMVEEMEEEDEEEARRIAQNAARRAKIIRELDQSRQVLRNREDIIRELGWLPRCEPRNFQGGIIFRDNERTLRCAFWERVEDHYSDSCMVFRNVEERKRVLQSRKSGLHVWTSCSLHAFAANATLLVINVRPEDTTPQSATYPKKVRRYNVNCTIPSTGKRKLRIRSLRCKKNYGILTDSISLGGISRCDPQFNAMQAQHSYIDASRG
ncbi:hypothetical protein Y032_0013g2144 [Ancylostoma ceylanicum]|nr:hypothetical protein Y032_0013g2144 [Ancylostoma ceylanicum]